MKTKLFAGIFAAILIMGVALVTFTQPVSAAALEQRGSWGAGVGQNTNLPAIGRLYSPLSEVEKDALQQAILEEYGAFNLYTAVINQFGSIYPFAQIVRSEQQHINVLVRQAEKYGVEVPANPGLAAAPAFTTVTEACQAGVKAEIADAALYDELKPVVTHTDLLRVFNNLQRASLNSHLPAFQSCD